MGGRGFDSCRTTYRSPVRLGDTMGDMRRRHLTSNETRFPEPEPGEVIVVERYGGSSTKGVIMHIDDFELFERYRRIFGQRVPYETRLTPTAVAANQLAERGGDEPDLDVESLDGALAE